MRLRKTLTFSVLAATLVIALSAWAQQKPSKEAQVSNAVRAGQGDGPGAKLLKRRGIDFAPAGNFLQDHLAAGQARSDSEGYLDAELLRAAEVGNTAALQQFLQGGANIESRDPNGDTPLALTAYGGYAEAVQLLLEKGADIETKNQYGDTPLCLAAFQGKTEVVKLLLDKGANIEAKDNQGRTPLFGGGHEWLFPSGDGAEHRAALEGRARRGEAAVG